MKKNRGSGIAFAIAYTYVGTVVGAGFASGQEIMAFFTVYGPDALIGIMISIAMFIFVGIRILLLGAKLGAHSFGEIIDQVFGLLAPLVKIYLIFAMLIINGAMLAGAGALFIGGEDIFYVLGILITAIAAIITLAFGIKGILSINRVIVLGIFTVQILIFITTLAKSRGFYAYPFIMEGNTGLYIKKGIFYGSMNIFLATGVLAGLGNEFNDIKTLNLGGLIGGIILGIMLITGHYSMACQGPMIFEHELPMLYLISNLLSRRGIIFSQVATFIYSIILWGGIFTTLIGNLYSMVSYLRGRIDINHTIISIILVTISAILSSLGFAGIVNNLYPLLGLIGTVFIVVIMVSSGR